MKKLTLCLSAGGILSFALWTDAFSQGTTSAPNQIPCGAPQPGRPILSLPFTIDECGRYYLIDCETGVADEHGIIIDADGVTLDLNGFALTGVAGSKDGVHVMGGRVGITIQGGHLSSWGESGVQASGASAVVCRDLMLRNNGNHGLELGSDGIVTSSVAQDNGTGSVGDGFRLGFNSIITDSVSTLNSGAGFVLTNACRASGCVAATNTGAGFSAADGNAVTGCSSVSNSAGFVATINNNCFEGNLTGGSSPGFDIQEPGNFLFRNKSYSGGYSIVPGNHYGAILNLPGDGFADDNPWSNVEF